MLHVITYCILKLYLVSFLTSDLAFSFTLLLRSKIATYPIATSKQMMNPVTTAITIKKTRFKEGSSNIGISESLGGISPNLKSRTHVANAIITKLDYINKRLANYTDIHMHIAISHNYIIMYLHCTPLI